MAFQIKDYMPDFRRLPADYLLWMGVSMIGSAIATWWAAAADNAPNLTSVGWLATFVVLAFALMTLFAFGAWVVSSARRQWNGASLAHGHQKTELAGAKKPEYVQFRLLTNWELGLGFQLQTLEPDEAGKRNQAEEVHVQVFVVRRMQNVQFELTANRSYRNSWQPIAKIGSECLSGTVHKDMLQKFVVMRRVFRSVRTHFDDPFTGTTREVMVRSDKEVRIFPENPAAFVARLGEEYLFSIVMFHDDGPERAHFVLKLDSTLSLPQTRFLSCENIEPLFSAR